MKWRNSKERELLASGGSRDQTLPNKNNPNPDLSDARCDRAASISPTPSSPNDSGQPSNTSAQSSNTVTSIASLVTTTPTSRIPSSQKISNQQPQNLKTKFDLTKPVTNVDTNQRDPSFKFEFDENNRPAFGNFFERGVYTNGGQNMTHNNLDSNNMKLNNDCYDDYDSNSDDSDEEINVT